jgi:xylulokinase
MSQLLAIDLGTSSVKVLCLTETGQTLSQGSAEYPIQRPQPEQAEQAPAEWWQATISATQQCLAGRADKSQPISAIGLSGQMHGTVLLDQADHLLCPAIIWPDQRSQPQVQEITARIGAAHLIEVTGSPVATGFQAATLRWMQQERPNLWRQVKHVLLPKDYLRWRLTGQFATDPSDASGTLLCDVRRRNWSAELLASLEIGPNLLPQVQPATAIAGQLIAEAAAQLKLPTGTPVVTGAADTACSILGAGVVDDQTLLLSLSSGGQLLVPVRQVQVDRSGRLHTFCGALTPSPEQTGWYQMGAILSAGLALRWLRDNIFALSGADAYTRMTDWAATAPLGAKGLLFLPYLMGERTPHLDPQARGIFLGLKAGHGRAELVRAVMEGVALACYDAFAALAEVGARPQRIVLAGGGAQSELWQQIMADVFNLPLQPLISGEQSARGAALLAGEGLGQFQAGAAAQTWASYGPVREPNQANHHHFQELLHIFRQAYQKHREDFQQLAKL